ncbi:hypothetical protein ACJ2A9_02650 [Anaerobacillus sp. MEB173]|uniref:hypothetical protein n=1 Tax=Anaerobacillus sp. MEB173 TaxID=3383345 RepID=UPI003F8FBFE3
MNVLCDVKLTYEQKLFEGLELEKVMVSPNEDIGVAVFISDEQSNDAILRFYSIKREGSEPNFQVLYEIQAVSLLNKDIARDFIERLTELSPIDLMLLLSPDPTFLPTPEFVC